MTRGYIIAASTVSILIGVFLFAISADDNLPDSVLTGLASSLFSIGAVTIVADVVLRRVYTTELLDMVGLDEHVYQTGLRALTSDSNFDWSWLIEAPTGPVRVLLLEPTAWAQREWPKLIELATARALTIDIYLPDATWDPSVESAARAVGQSPDAYRANVAQISDRLKTTWRAARDGTTALHADSTLSIVPTRAQVNHGLLACGDRLAFLIPVAFPETAQQGAMLVAAFDRSDGKSRWRERAQQVWHELDRSRTPPLWTDRRLPVASKDVLDADPEGK